MNLVIETETLKVADLQVRALSRCRYKVYLPAHSRNMDDVHLECRVHGAPPTQLYDGNLHVGV